MLDYERRRQRQRLPEDTRSRYAAFKFFLGFGVSVAVSAVVWPLVMRPGSEGAMCGWVVGMPVLKAFFACCFTIYPPFKLVGAGLLASIPVGSLIFLSQCGPVA
jgi:hypothetical protein